MMWLRGIEMKTKMVQTMVLAAALTCAILPAGAQGRGDNPNMRNFYMARQQIQIMDDAPQVNDMRTNPGAGAQGGAPAVAAPQPLPRASFNSYMSGYAGGGGRSGLPTVVNGVPPKLPSAPERTGLKANAGKLKIKSTPTAKGPTVAKSYSPYATYPSAPSGGSSAPAGGSMLNTNTSVRGSVLHWNKRRSGY